MRADIVKLIRERISSPAYWLFAVKVILSWALHRVGAKGLAERLVASAQKRFHGLVASRTQAFLTRAEKWAGANRYMMVAKFLGETKVVWMNADSVKQVLARIHAADLSRAIEIITMSENGVTVPPPSSGKLPVTISRIMDVVTSSDLFIPKTRKDVVIPVAEEAPTTILARKERIAAANPAPAEAQKHSVLTAVIAGATSVALPKPLKKSKAPETQPKVPAEERKVVFSIDGGAKQETLLRMATPIQEELVKASIALPLGITLERVSVIKIGEPIVEDTPDKTEQTNQGESST